MATQQSLSIEDVRAIADLARLDLSDAELARYTTQLSAILSDFQLLQEVDTSHIDAASSSSVLPAQNVMREDIAKAPLDRDEALANAPLAEDGQFRVAAVLGDD